MPDPSNTSLTLPTWAEEIRRKYESGEASQFLIHGNIFDLTPLRGEFVWLRDFLIRALAGSKKIVLTYNLSEGIRLETQAMKDDFKRFIEVLQSAGTLPAGVTQPALLAERPDLIKDPNVALALIERLIETRNQVFVVLDHLDKICPPNEMSYMSSDDRRTLTTLQRWSRHPRLQPPAGEMAKLDIAVLFIAENLAGVHPEIRGNPLMEIVEISFPDSKEREEFIRHRAAEYGIDLTDSNVNEHVTPDQFAYHTAGLTRVSIQSFLRQAHRSGSPISLAMIRERKHEMLREQYGGLVQVVEPAFGIDSVAGMDTVKRDLRLVIELLQSGNRSECPMGIGFVGPPGTGKTMMAQAVAHDAGLPFLTLGEIRAKYVGESERNADRVLTLLRSIAPVVVFVDEIDQAFGSRGERDDSGVSQRIWAKFSEIQGDSAYRGQILWIWATNRPDIMDEATKRPGRLGDLKIPFFFAAEDPEAVIRRTAEKNGIELRAGDLKPVLSRVNGYSAAELAAVTLQARWVARRNGHKTVTSTDFVAAAEDFMPSRNDRMIEFMELMAVAEASSRRLLPEAYRSVAERDALAVRLHALRAELTGMGLL